ncbi:sigma-70 family RNA polymerase sigma factor [uncultured Shimia sp.]|uniref:RNA polymerase sigma factor n=1 Tax=uncultured Shimia sp. TaxID=573152 RepID=UPI00262881F2|nr:sigma-70 family RNA polymerase sigma factor [uncultured Shimia sp.]
MEATDQKLADQAKAGNGTAFATLLARHYDRIFALAFRMSSARAEAEDLTQDICAALPSKLMRFDGQSRFSTWLYRVVVNAAHDRRRRQASHTKAAEGWGDWEVARQAANAETAERIDWLTRAMRALPDDLRDTLALVLDDMTHADVGEVLEVSEGTVSWRISEAKKRLKELKEKEENA